MKEPEMAQIAALIAEALRGRDDTAVLADVRQRVAALCARFPVYS
jgi:glycine/serine hydroxymethyltransferase